MIWHRMDEGGLSMCEYWYGRCTAPDTRCPHWIGTFCELDEAYKCIYIQNEGK